MEEITSELNTEEELPRQGELKVYSWKRLERTRYIHVSFGPESMAKVLFLYKEMLTLIQQGWLRVKTGKCLQENHNCLKGYNRKN